MYYGLIPIIEARQQLYAFEASSFPEMKEGDRRRTQKRYDRALESAEDVLDSEKIEATWEIFRKGRKKKKVKKDAGRR